MGSFRVSHRFPIDEAGYWEKVFFNEAFNKAFYLEKLGFERYEVKEDRTEPDGKRHRVIETVPKAQAPAAVKKIIGESLVYIERGVYDPAGHRYTFDIDIPRFSDKVSVSGAFWTEGAGDSACDRICTMDVSVKIFGVGKVVEGFIENTTKQSYEDAAQATVAFIQQNLSGA